MLALEWLPRPTAFPKMIYALYGKARKERASALLNAERDTNKVEITTMQKIKVKKAELLEVLEKNRNAHNGIFREAQDGFRKLVIAELEKRLELARKGKKFDLYMRLPEPEDHTRDYERIISMLKMDLNDTVELSETDYSQYVLDDWEWKRQFLGTNRAYSLRAAKLADELGGEA